MKLNKYRVKNCPAISFADGCKNEEVKVWDCQDCTDCVLKQIVQLCKEQKVINCNIDGKEQVLKAFYHTHLSNKILELLDIQEVE